MKTSNYKRSFLAQLSMCFFFIVCFLGSSKKEITQFSYPTLYMAAANGDLDDVKRHIAFGEDVNALGKNELGWTCTPLNAALNELHAPNFWTNADSQRFNVALYLINHGADLNYSSKNNLSIYPLSILMDYGISIVKLAVDKGANVQLVDSQGTTFMDEDAMHGDTSIANYLLSLGLRINTNSEILHNTALLGNFLMVEYLIKHGCPVNAIDQYGLTPLDEAYKFTVAAPVPPTPSQIDKLKKTMAILKKYGGMFNQPVEP
jgi:ankyrin repeat protein